MNHIPRIQVHRFRDRVAVAMLGGEEPSPTAYLSAELARQLGDALLRFAAEVREVPIFSDSKVGTAALGDEAEGGGAE